jgi:hypothetical protein
MYDSGLNMEPGTNKSMKEPLLAYNDHQVVEAGANLEPLAHQELEGPMKVESSSGSLQYQTSSPVKFMSRLEAAVFESLEHKLSGQCTIVYYLMWELPSYLTKLFSSEQRLGGILTLTGGNVNAFGSSCKVYLKKMFPAIGLPVLECLEKMLQDPDACTFSLLFYFTRTHN